MKKILMIVAISLLATNMFGQCAPVGTESQTVLVPLLTNQNTAANQGVGSGASRIYDGFVAGNSYTLALNNGPGNLSCRQGRFLNSANGALGSWFNLASSTTQTSPAGTAKLIVATSRSSAWNTTSATLTYRINRTVTTPVAITGTVSAETCPGDNDGSISSVSINNEMANGVQYIKLVQRRTTDNHINLRELQAFEIFTGTNVALGATVTGKFGALGGYPFSNLTDNDFGNGTSGMAHTGTAAFGTWMQVNLGAEYDLDFVRIFNRTDCCQSRANNLLIEYYDGSYNLLYSTGINASAASSDYNVLDVSWSDGGSTLNRTGLSGGTYTLSYSDIAGNSGSQAFVVNTTNTASVIPTSLSASSTQICDGNSVVLTVNGGSRGTGASTWDIYSGSCGGTLVGTTTGTTLSVSPSTTTTYYVRASGTCNTTGCESVTVGVAPSISISSSITDENCSADNDGEIDITISGGLSNVRYIRIEQLEANVINLAELLATEIFTGTNVAAGATVTQSSNHPCCTPSNLTDGNTSNFAHTNGSTGDWMRVDLGGTFNLDNITIHNRSDCCWDRSDNLRLELYDASNTLIYAENIDVYQSINAANSETFNVLEVSWSDAGSPLDRTGLDAGSYTLSYSDVGGCTDTEVGVVGTVNANAAIVSVSGTSPLCLSGSATYTRSGEVLGGGTGAWTSSNTGVATVNSSTGVVTPVAGGTTNIIYTITGGCGGTVSAQQALTVDAAANSAVLVSGSTVSAVASCVEAPWTYYANASTPDEYIFAIRKNGNTFVANVEIVDQSGTATYSSTGGAGPDRGTFLIGRHWNVTLASGSVVNPVDVRFFVDPAEVTQAQNEANAFQGTTAFATTVVGLSFFKTVGIPYSPGMMGGGNFTFTPEYLSHSTGTLNGVTYYELTGLTSFSGGTGGFSVNDNGATLPVELLSWEANAINNELIELAWSTATEINNDRFEIQRSTDGENFEDLATEAGNGNSSSVINYTYQDREVSKGVRYYYRLKQIDNDGTSETFGIVSAMLSSKGRNIIGNLIPNPSKENGVVSVSISTVSEEAITVNIYNHVGSRVASYQEFVAEGNNNMQININDLASGTYFINFEGSFGRETRKLVLIK